MRVPLGRGDRLSVGYCVRVDAQPPAGLDPARIKDVVEVLDPLPLIDAKMLELTRWLADYYACSWGQALDAAVPAGVKKHAGTRIGTFLIVPEETRAALRAETLKTAAHPQAGRRARGPLPWRRAADHGRRLPAGEVYARPNPGAAEARAGAYGPEAAARRTAVEPARPARLPQRARMGRRATRAATTAGSRARNRQAASDPDRRPGSGARALAPRSSRAASPHS